MSILLKYCLAWFPMLLIAVLNGALRDLGYKRYMSELAAHQVSTFSLIAFFAIYVHYITEKIPPASSRQAITVGILWLVLTLCFEFGFGWFRGRSWETLLSDYNLADGRLWVLIPAFTAIAPYIFYRLRK